MEVRVGFKESWALKNGCFWTVVLEKPLESPLDWKEIKLFHPKGNQYWIFFGRTDAEIPKVWPPDVKHWLIGKKRWCWERLKVGENGDDRGWDGWIASPTWWTWVICSPWGWKELDMTEWLNWTELITIYRRTLGIQGFGDILGAPWTKPLLISGLYMECWASHVTLVLADPPANAGDEIIWVWSLGQEDPLKDTALQYPCQENFIGKGAWRATVHGITNSQTPLRQLSTAQHSRYGMLIWCN